MMLQKISIPYPLFKQKFISKFQDKICLENILFVKSLNNLTLSVFSTYMVDGIIPLYRFGFAIQVIYYPLRSSNILEHSLLVLL